MYSVWSREYNFPGSVTKSHISFRKSILTFSIVSEVRSVLSVRADHTEVGRGILATGGSLQTQDLAGALLACMVPSLR